MLIEELKRGLEVCRDLKHLKAGCRSNGHTGNANNCKRYHQGSNETSHATKVALFRLSLRVAHANVCTGWWRIKFWQTARCTDYRGPIAVQIDTPILVLKAAWKP